MNTWLFISLICMGQQCDFVNSTTLMPQAKCQLTKKQFFDLPFKPEVTFKAAQCIEIDDGKLRI